jgi:hypothetical protein
MILVASSFQFQAISSHPYQGSAFDLDQGEALTEREIEGQFYRA